MDIEFWHLETNLSKILVLRHLFSDVDSIVQVINILINTKFINFLAHFRLFIIEWLNKLESVGFRSLLNFQLIFLSLGLLLSCKRLNSNCLSSVNLLLLNLSLSIIRRRFFNKILLWLSLFLNVHLDWSLSLLLRLDCRWFKWSFLEFNLVLLNCNLS